MVTVDDRGQAFTLEGFIAALLLLASLAFVLQSTGVTPLSSSTSSQHVENQQAAMAGGLLDIARADGSLRPALLYWNDANGTFHGTEPPASGDGYYMACGMPTAFGDHLARTFDDQGLACNVIVRYVNSTTGDVATRRMIYVGAPTDTAMRAVASITLYDDDTLYAADGTPTGTTLTSIASDPSAAFYAPDADPDGPVYNVVRVEVIVWRT